MADRRQLSEDEVGELLLQVAAASDLARASGLELSGQMAAIRSEQAGIEAARLRFKRGRESQEAAMAVSSAKVRGERGDAATAAGEKARKDIRGLLKRGGFDVKPPKKDRAFTVGGKVTRRRKGVPGLVVEARTSKPVRSVAQCQSGERGEFELSIADLGKLKRKLDSPAGEPLMLTLVALKDRRIVARSDAPFEARPGERVSRNLAIG